MNGGTISNNTAPEAGGGLYYANGTVKLNGGTIENNTATHYGGGVYEIIDFKFRRWHG
ncbi:MAG: hypothetical protein V8R01_05785 [Bacilli bacterium]